MYSEGEIITLENKKKYLNTEAQKLTEEIENLRIVKESMNGAISKISTENKQTNKRAGRLIL